MKKILVINTIGLNYEGITSVIFNYSNHINLDNIHLEFIAFEGVNPELKKKFEKIGTVHVVPNRKKNLKGYWKAIKILLKKNLDVVHIHGNSGTMLLEVLLAKAAGVKKVILHSHSTATSYPIANQIMKPLMNHLADERLACSKEAGEWLYEQHPFIVLNNAIDTKKFAYNTVVREEVRKEFELTDEVLIGHIGHFSPSKNHLFLLNIFSELHKSHKDTKLLLVSSRLLFDEMKKQTKEYGLEDAVIFAGRRSDVERLYQAMDIFVLPSKWEGLGMVLVEAQASGLPVLASDIVPPLAKCTDNLEFYPLEKGAEAWSEKIWQMVENKKTGQRCSDVTEKIAECGFDIKEEARKLEKIYFKS